MVCCWGTGETYSNISCKIIASVYNEHVSMFVFGTWFPAAFFLFIWLILCWALHMKHMKTHCGLAMNITYVSSTCWQAPHWSRSISNSLSKSNKVLMVGVHIGELDVYQQQHLHRKREVNVITNVATVAIFILMNGPFPLILSNIIIGSLHVMFHKSTYEIHT